MPTSLYDGNDPDPELVDQSLCGGTTNNELGCGNQSTRWIGFVDNSAIARVQKVMLIVEDDDRTTGNNNADSEHLSFIGANAVRPPDVLLVKRITAVNGNRTVNLNDNTPQLVMPLIGQKLRSQTIFLLIRSMGADVPLN